MGTKQNSGIPSLADVAALENLETAREFYDKRFSDGYMEEDDWPESRRRRIAKLIADLPLPRSGTVLDFGCGTGVFTAVLVESLPGWKVVGTDVSAAALDRARQRLSQCEFIALEELDSQAGRFDLVFSHHVLEHVSDLKSTAQVIERTLSSSGAMFHVLPCGNAGSFAYNICQLVRGGIQREAGGRFFFEEIGHLRRLTTEQLVALWHAAGFRAEQAYYSEQWFGAVSSVTQFHLQFVRDFTDPSLGVDEAAAAKLSRYRAALTALWLARQPAMVVRRKLAFGIRSLRDFVLLVGGIVCYPVSITVDWLTKRLAEWEWSRRRGDAGGSEMYVFLKRPANLA